MRYSLLLATLMAAFQLSLGAAIADGVDPAAAEVQFKKSCGTCHTVDPAAPPRQGPNLFAVMGRPAGALEGFKYSPAFEAGKVGVTWDEATLDRWITDPQSVIPRTTMLYKQTNAEKRLLIIEFLKLAQ